MTINRPLKDFARFRQITTPTKPTQQAASNTTTEREQRQAKDNAWSELQEIITAHAGQMSFDNAPDGRGTEARVQFAYVPPAGKAGNTVLKLQGKTPKQEVSEALRHFKAVMESGEVVTTEGQPVGPR